MPRLTLSFFGEYQVTLDDHAVDMSYNKVRALLAYLAVSADQPHSREELAALLWPDASEVTARKNLRQALTTLRASLSNEGASIPFLQISREAIQFNRQSDYSLDVTQFNQLVAACKKHRHERLEACPECLERLTQAAQLYKGELLRGFSIPDSLPFEEWLLLTREGLNLLMIDLLADLAMVYERTQQEDAALQIARRRLVYEPWNEDAYRTLMRVLARRGQRTAALAEFERCKRVLAEELSIEPSKETLDLYWHIQRETHLQPQQDSTTTATPIQPVQVRPLHPSGELPGGSGVSTDRRVLSDQADDELPISGTDCAYAAGILDSEGSISLIRNHRDRWPSPQVSVASTDRELVEWLKGHFGGTITTKQQQMLQQSLSYEWKITERRALRFLQMVRPFMVIGRKICRCDLLLRAYVDCTPRNGRYTEEMVQKKRDLLEEFAGLR